MSVLTQLFDKRDHHLTASAISARARSRVSAAKVSEACWGVTSFVLFLALGPFAAMAAVFGLASLVKGQEGKLEPEVAR